MSQKVFQKSWVSPLTGFSFAIVSVTGMLMLFEVRLPGMKGIHEWVGLLFVIAGAIHLAFNWRAFVAYLRQRKALVVLALVLLFSVGMLAMEGKDEGHHGPGRFREGQEMTASDVEQGAAARVEVE